MIFWHESSANEPSGAARSGRAWRPSAADIAAMSIAGGGALFGLSPGGRGQCGRPFDHGADRPALSGAALLRLAPDGGAAGAPRTCCQTPTGPAFDDSAGAGGGHAPPTHDPEDPGAPKRTMTPPPGG